MTHLTDRSSEHPDFLLFSSLILCLGKFSSLPGVLSFKLKTDGKDFASAVPNAKIIFSETFQNETILATNFKTKYCKPKLCLVDYKQSSS